MWRGKYSVIKSDDLQSLGKTNGWIGQDLASIPLLRAALIYMKAYLFLQRKKAMRKEKWIMSAKYQLIYRYIGESAVWLCSKSPQAPHVVNWIVNNI